MKILYSQSTQQILDYPRMDNEPIVGLDPDLIVLNQVELPQPNYDPETETVNSNWVIDLDNLEYCLEWQINPVVTPVVPNWDGFNATMLGDSVYNQTTGYLLTVAPSVAIAVPTALAQVSTNGITAFALVFNAFCQYGNVTTQQRNDWAIIAENFNLPVEFVKTIRGVSN